ncbi:DNA cytosine methyltransferase [Methylobacterium sp. NEAU K]|uniref:DNA cytosine methyltransferase n=1 Tax=Methylobacterium sp. NEAU K TaxID=3064946 RepID=UPI002736070E|nr:DNA (cytosine-5-)-methyltransferase [Methylobacterium sp. NEAU K]MDP4005163.1 DNA (cytosine-5-)-methyltransferase [Methylobacterium sp. NEAU K]
MYDARGTDAPWYQARDLTETERAAFRATTLAAQQAKRQALSGDGPLSKHPINKPRLSAKKLMPMLRRNGMTALSLFSGGGGMDIGFDRAGFDHAASYDILEPAAVVLRAAHPQRTVFGGAAGDVTRVDWRRHRGTVDVLHGGPPCQPFSHAGRRQGSEDARDMIPEFVRAVQSVRPRAFVCENVSGLLTKRFADYVQATILTPLRGEYTIKCFHLDAADFGVPQRRRRVFFVGFREREAAEKFVTPQPTHCAGHLTGSLSHLGLPRTMGAREALGLTDIGVDDLAPTIRSGLTGPRHTTSILNSVTAQRVWHSLGIWPNGVALTREMASSYVAKHDHFRLSVPDCMVLQGFPEDWPITKPVYMALGLIGNSVAPPMAYRLARSVAQALRGSTP